MLFIKVSNGIISGEKQMQHSKRFLQISEQARQAIKEISPQAVNAGLAAKENFVLIDVREQSEWDNGHVPNAIHLSKGIIERDIEKVVPNIDQKIILYCGGGFRSALAAYNLQQMGYRQVYSMTGGYRLWCSLDEGEK